jgi:hypothetical protein
MKYLFSLVLALFMVGVATADTYLVPRPFRPWRVDVVTTSPMTVVPSQTYQYVVPQTQTYQYVVPQTQTYQYVVPQTYYRVVPQYVVPRVVVPNAVAVPSTVVPVLPNQ